MERSVPPYEQFGYAVPLSDATLRIHVVDATDTISSIAFQYYGDHLLWRPIAKRNAIADVRKLEPGTELIIPDREPKRGRYESL